MEAQMHDPIKQAVRLMLAETDSRNAFTVRCQEFFQWNCNLREADLITSGWFNGPKPLCSEAVAIAVSVSKLDFVTPILKAQSELRQMDGLDYEEDAVLESLAH